MVDLLQNSELEELKEHEIICLVVVVVVVVVVVSVEIFWLLLQR
jgi:hypothetical protein